MPKNVANVLEKCRKMQNFHVVHLRANYVYGRSPHLKMFSKLLPSLPDEILDTSAEPWAREIEGEVVVKKPTYSGFHDTELHQVLQKLGVTTVMGCGLITTKCVHETL